MRMYVERPGEEPREWPVDFDAAPPEDYEAVEALGIWPSFDAFVEACQAASRTAWRVQLWLCMRRGNPDLKLSDVRPRSGEFALRWNPDEELRIAELALEDPATTDEERVYWNGVLPDLKAAAAEFLGKETPAGAPVSDPEPSPGNGTSAAGISPDSSASGTTSG